MKIVGKFVWVQSPRGPVPEKWPLDIPRADMTKAAPAGKVVLKEYPLNADQYHMRIAILEQRYPKP